MIRACLTIHTISRRAHWEVDTSKAHHGGVVPTSPLGGLLVGLLDGLIVTALVLLAVSLAGRRRRRRHPETTHIKPEPGQEHASEDSDEVAHAA